MQTLMALQLRRTRKRFPARFHRTHERLLVLMTPNQMQLQILPPRKRPIAARFGARNRSLLQMFVFVVKHISLPSILHIQTPHFLRFKRLFISAQTAHIALILRIVLRAMLSKSRHRQKRLSAPREFAHEHFLPIHYAQSRGSDPHSCVFTCSRRFRSDLNSFPQPGN